MGDYEIHRSVTVASPPERVHALVDDFHQWVSWSPWEGLDPDIQRTYAGAGAGLGSTYAWSGNRKAGRGRMEITGSSPHKVQVALTFDKPFPSTSKVTFEIVPLMGGSSAEVTWRMAGNQKGVAALFGKVVPMDKLLGKDLERGLAQMKVQAESGD